MKKILPVLWVLVLGCKSAPDEEFIAEISATAALYAIEKVEVDQYKVLAQKIGIAHFDQSDDRVRLTIFLESMRPNTQKAVHIHNGSLASPGRHWNQGHLFAACNLVSMGRAWDKPFLGDVGNVPIGSNGKGMFTLITDLWRINSGDSSDVLNKVLIIHDEPQDFSKECTPSHEHNHDNAKIGGGMITLVSEVPEN